jgi:hypothetical protein
VYVGDCTREEVALLVELLRSEFPGPRIESAAESELKANPKELVRLNRDWDDITPYLGEFDFGLYDFRFPEVWKQLVHINDSADRFARSIKELRGKQNDNGERTEKTFEVYDKDAGQVAFFNTQGAQSWGPVESPDDPISPDWLTVSCLYRHGSEGWTLLVARHLCEPVAPAPMPEAERLDPIAAVSWLMSNGFPLPADVAHLKEKLLFVPGPPTPSPKDPAKQTIPAWNKDRCELTYRGSVIKRVKSASVAKNVVRVLDAFQEDDWPDRIDDPLDPSKKKDQQRLHETIKRLNDNLDVIRFRADGTGQGIRWELTAPELPQEPPDTPF